MVVSWMLRSIDPNLIGTIPFHEPFHEEAKPLWNYLGKRFSVANGPRLQQIRASIIDCKQGRSQSLEDYYTKLMNLYDDFARLKPLHRCECGKCTCNLAEKYAQDRVEEIFHQFLTGIDDEEYGNVRSTLLSQIPLPDLDRAYQTFLQEEKIKGIKKEKAEKVETHIFTVKGTYDTRAEKEKLHCTDCKKSGHDVSSCFKIHGPPSWWIEKYGGGRGGGRSVQHIGGTSGATNSGSAAGERSKGFAVVRANAMVGGEINEPGAAPTMNAAATRGTFGGTSLSNLTPEQLHAL